jgi:MFS superfamily sulfate permease-like transporter
VITILAILFTDLLIGIMIGILAGLFFVLRSNFRTTIMVVRDGNQFLFRLKKDVSFLNKPILKQRLEEVPDNAEVLIDATRADFIDKDVIEVMNDFLRHAHLKNITVDIKRSVHKPLEQIIDMSFKDEILKPELKMNTNIKKSMLNFNPA